MTTGLGFTTARLMNTQPVARSELCKVVKNSTFRANRHSSRGHILRREFQEPRYLHPGVRRDCAAHEPDAEWACRRISAAATTACTADLKRNTRTQG
jgi:hypothetical protein